MAKLHKFINPYFMNGLVKYHPGLAYEPNDETSVAVAQGHAEEVESKAAPAVPFHDPRQVEARKAAIRNEIAALEKELERLESLPAPTPAPDEKKGEDKKDAGAKK